MTRLQRWSWRLDASVSECSAHVDDAGLPVHVALLERDPLTGSQAGRRGERHDRAIALAKLFGKPVELVPRFRTAVSRCAGAAGSLPRAWRD